MSSQLGDIHFYSFCPILCFAVGVEKQGPIQNSYRTLTQLNNKKTHYPVKKWAKHLNTCFFKEDLQQANHHTERPLASSVTLEMQFKTIMRSRFPPSRTAMTEKPSEQRTAGSPDKDAEEAGTRARCWWGRNMQRLQRTVWWSLQKLNIGAPGWLGWKSMWLISGS